MALLKLIGDSVVRADGPAPTEASLADWRDDPGAHGDAQALVVPNDAGPADLAAAAGAVAIIILEFPSFRDGRAYSQARLLRSRFGFRGEIRARGDILRDQLPFMRRCGITAFEVNGLDAEAADAALGGFSYVYQTSADGAAPVWRRRLDRAAAA